MFRLGDQLVSSFMAAGGFVAGAIDLIVFVIILAVTVLVVIILVAFFFLGLRNFVVAGVFPLRALVQVGTVVAILVRVTDEMVGSELIAVGGGLR
jgi:hypothetical protein